MKNIVVIYWSGTGNTEEMAKAIFEGASLEGNTVALLSVDEATIEHVLNADAVAFGCPSMGAEQLEESEMEPFIESISGTVKDKDIALFGSYGWGDGEWMRSWEEKMLAFGAKLIKGGLMINNNPDQEGFEQCKKLGEALAKS